MGMLDRYKKKGGFIQLLNLIETTPQAKAEKFLSMIAEENPAWENEIRKKSLTIKKMASWPQQTLMEVMPTLTANVVASAISTLPSEIQEVFLQAAGFSERRKIEDLLKDSKPNPAESSTSQMKILTETRGLISQGQLKLEKIDPELTIPENIEEILASGAQTAVNLHFQAEISSGPTNAHSAPTTASASMTNTSMVNEELMMLRKKIVSLTQENQLLKQQLQIFKEKIDAVRKAAA